MKDQPTSHGQQHPTVDEPSQINEIGSGLAQLWFARDWKRRPQQPDYHIDYILERVDNGELSGRLLGIQQKAHRTLVFTDGFAAESLSKKHLRYYLGRLELPVILLSIDTTSQSGYFLFLQEWLDQNGGLAALTGNGTKNVRVPQANRVVKNEPHRVELVHDSSRGFLNSAFLQPAFAVLGLHVANGQTLKKRREVFDAGQPASHGACFQTVLGGVLPTHSHLVERKPGLLADRQVTDLSPKLDQTPFGQLAIFGFEGSAKLLVAPFEQSVITATGFQAKQVFRHPMKHQFTRRLCRCRTSTFHASEPTVTTLGCNNEYSEGMYSYKTLVVSVLGL